MAHCWKCLLMTSISRTRIVSNSSDEACVVLVLVPALFVAGIRAGAPLFDVGADRLFSHGVASNNELLSSLREDTNGAQLQKIAFDDAAKHRMTTPVRACDFDTRQVPC